MKNVMYAGLLAALLEIDLEVIRQLLTESYAKKPALVEANIAEAKELLEAWRKIGNSTDFAQPEAAA